MTAVPITDIKGVGTALSLKLAKLGIYSLQDLLFHLPTRYQDRTRIRPIGSLQIGEEVLIEGYSDETDLLLKGRSRRQAPDIDGHCLITAGQANVGDYVTLRITDSSDYDLIGEICDGLDTSDAI